jgi:hypothetical protein
MSKITGPFTPTTATVLLDCANQSIVGPIDLTGLDSDGWPSTFFVSNTGAAPAFVLIGTNTWFGTVDQNAGTVIMPGQSMIYQVESPGSATTANPLVAFTYGLGATAIAVTGGINA